jgi:hypothetical protein
MPQVEPHLAFFFQIKHQSKFFNCKQIAKCTTVRGMQWLAAVDFIHRKFELFFSAVIFSTLS